ncbi:MAG: heparinase II/III-family protein [Armatimonadetes bacterium]|nr:heparinase II/III-family protein [Armatimonadota bacterium]MDW8029337.1 heparinase II/III family protein [Armatimonadota bacterium]
MIAKMIWLLALVFATLTLGLLGGRSPMVETPTKTRSTFFCPERVQRLRQNIAKYSWAKETAQRIVKVAEFWKQMSDDELWALMFSPTITRSWHVWSNGFCPACKKPVPMYNWRIDALRYQWKVQCPHCKKFFPTNDFSAFYRSGLNERGIFDPKRADRSLLFNAEHPDPNDPLHKFGVDDGEGYVEGGNRWRFIGAYLIYGQWKQLVLGGIRNLAAAYLVTGEKIYARKAGILLDRVADLYPQFDFRTQAVVYERHLGSNGYVSIWHDACEETRLMALAYDAVFEALQDDNEFFQFLHRKALHHRLPNPKADFADIQRNIEEGILLDPLRNEHKIHSNFPRTPFTKAVLLSVLSWEQNKSAVTKLLDETLQKATAVDGVTGEKGLAGYAAFATRAIAEILALFDVADNQFLRRAVERLPLRSTFRFHLDTWALSQYYPNIGDAGSFARKVTQYVGVPFIKLPSDADAIFVPSNFTLFWRLYELTGDADFVRIIFLANGRKIEGLPHDLFAENHEEVQVKVTKVIAEQGEEFSLKSVNKQNWCLAILRSGKGENERVVWLDYDSDGGHGHFDGMNLGMFAFGLDLMPDFGYPPVQFGGWDSPKARWYFMTAAHNTVLVDGKNQASGKGTTTLWHDGEKLKIVRASAPNLVGGKQYERAIALVDIDEQNFYVVDIFRVIGGTKHDKFVHSHFGKANVNAKTQPVEMPKEYAGTQMRNFEKIVPANKSLPLQVDWLVEDRYGYLPKGEQIRLRYFDLTENAQAFLCEGWIALGMSTTEDAWIQRLMVRLEGKSPLQSTFVAVIVPFVGESSPIKEIHRLQLRAPDSSLYNEANVALEIVHADGNKDLIIAMDTENPLNREPDFRNWQKVEQPEWQISTSAPFCFIRKDDKGRIMIACEVRVHN